MVETALDINRRIGHEINAEALRDPSSPYTGKFLGVVDGKVAIVADTLNELGDGLRRIGAKPGEAFCIHAGHDYSRVEYIWCVDNPPQHIQGIACFRFLNQFTYGNFGNIGRFGLQSP